MRGSRHRRIDMSTQTKLAAYFAEAEANRRRYNDSWALAHDRKCPTCGHHVESDAAEQSRHASVSDETDREKADIRRRMLADSETRRLVCDKAVTFQAGDAFEDNYELETELRKAFPRGVGDSESGQGWFYVPSDLADEVVAFLADRATDVEVDDQPEDSLTVNWEYKGD